MTFNRYGGRIKIALVGAVGSILALTIRRTNPEIALLITLAAGILILLSALDIVEGLQDVLNRLSDTSGLTTAVLAPVLKTVGAGVVTKIAADLCRDAGAGASAIASSVEFFGAAAAVYVAAPLLQTVFSMVGALL